MSAANCLPNAREVDLLVILSVGGLQLMDYGGRLLVDCKSIIEPFS